MEEGFTVRRLTVFGVVFALSLSALANGALAADNGTVNVSVNATAPCVTITGQFAYGSLPFSTSGAASTSGVTIGPSITNCSGTSEQFVAKVSSLVNGTSTWTPAAPSGTPCPTLNTFKLNVSGFGAPSTDLSGTDQAIGSLTTATPILWASVFTMPCTGSSGAGVPMSGTITLTASF
jgi:hypothetical protein